MKNIFLNLHVFLFLTIAAVAFGQETDTISGDSRPIVDNVWLKDGSTLSGTIQKWELARGMEFKLMTGALLVIPKNDIAKVYQGVPFDASQFDLHTGYTSGRRPYAFKETGMYNTFSVFLNFSFSGGAGIHYSAGHKFSRLLGVGIGTGFETNDFDYSRRIIPLFAEVRGYFLPKKITPYYAFKIGYGFALNNVDEGTFDAKGGLYLSPELGVRFGGKNVNYYLGLEYKLQNATFTNSFFPWDGQGRFTDKLSYRRIEMRTGLLF